MADAHRHLMITQPGCEAFLDDFQRSLHRFAVPGREQCEPNAIVASLRDDIVV